MGIFGAMLHGFWYDLKDLVARHKLQYSSQIVETDTISLEFSGKLLRFILHTVFLTDMCLLHPPPPPPMLSHAYFEALRPLWYPNQRWGRGKRHKCFKIFDEYCSWQSCPWSLKLMMSQVVEGTWIRTGGYRRFRGEWVKSKRFFES